MAFKYKILGQARFGNELEDILELKGIKDISSFLEPTIKNTESELLFDNIELARDILTSHISKGSIIDLLVDCDCDGYTSAADIYQYIKRIKPSIEIRYFIHKTKIHGLADVVDSMCLDNAGLVIVPDAGSGDISECQKLKGHNKDVLILDHHNIRDKKKKIPANPAIVVNNQYSDKVTDKALTGAGVTYKFTKLLDKYYGVNYADDYLDLVALGMIGDRADTLNLEARYLVLKGLEQIRNKTNKNKLITEFVNAQMYSMDNKVTINSTGFYICPLINSLIRLGEYEDKCYMFEALCNSDKMLERKVKGRGMVNMPVQGYVLKACQASNRKQKKLTEESAAILSEEIERHGMDKLPVLVCNARENVDSNSTGLVANRLADQYQRPCLLMRRKGGVCKGSGRGYSKCEILDFNQWCKDTGLFSMVDGHPGAFGCEIPLVNIDRLLSLLSSMPYIDEPIYYVYNVYEAGVLHGQVIKNIAKYGYIWGNTVQEPVFLIKNVPCNKYSINLLGSKQNKIEFTYHNIKFTKQTRGGSLAAQYKEIINTGENIQFDIIGRFSVDIKCNKTPQVLVEDWMFIKSNIIQRFGVY